METEDASGMKFTVCWIFNELGKILTVPGSPLNHSNFRRLKGRTIPLCDLFYVNLSLAVTTEDICNLCLIIMI